VRDSLQRLEFAAVINAAAYTQVDRAESDAEACFRVNAEAVETLASICRERDCPLMQISTDHVFGADARVRRPFRETDEPGPVNVYGRSKLAGEQAARKLGKHFIVRTCGLYIDSPSGPHRGRNFVDTMLVLSRERKRLQIVNDQTCTPSYVPHVAAAILRLLECDQFGTFHVTNRGTATWFDFAEELFRQAGIPMALEPISSAQYGAQAPRPPYSVLDTSKFATLGICDLPEWQDGLRCYLQTSPATVLPAGPPA
jgi:dTDP-4-dehydrorhamnose reductase